MKDQDVKLAKAVLGVGPRGGDLGNVNQYPERRTAMLNVNDSGVNGMPGLHRFQKADTATMGTKNEQPWHRMAAFMLLAGRTNSEIAMAAGITPQTVCNLRAQRWFQDLLAVLANETGSDITGLLASEAQASLNKMIEVRDSTDDTVPERLRYQAARDIFELHHGKATQKIVSHTTHSSSVGKSPAEEMQEIVDQLAALREK